MRKAGCYILLYVLITYLSACNTKNENRNIRNGKPKSVNDWFINQRAFPYGKIDYQAYKTAVSYRSSAVSRMKMPGAGNHWQFAGCVNIGGRLTDVEMHPSDLQTMYIGAASGGVFKSADGGSTWVPVFDQQNSLSIGDLAVAPSNPAIIYVGTGESNGGGGSLTYDGNGIYKSTDSGSTWTNIGLISTRNTGRIAIDPNDPDRVFVATMGDLFGNGPDRGVYRTVNGGTSWQKVLFQSDSTGAVEVVINPLHSDTVYATLWERVRRIDRRNYGGPSSGIYRSFDGGNTWTKLITGLPQGLDFGRIGLDISKSSPNILYATLTDNFGIHAGIYKTSNHGDSWVDVTSNFSPVGASYWFGRIKIDPVDPQTVYQIDFDLWKTTDGGSNWNNISSLSGVHVDQHEIYIHPLNTDFLLLGNDGGLYQSADGGITWIHDETMPVTQFYTCEIDETNPSNIYGGTQDNGVIGTITGNLNDWFSIWGGDGFVVLVDPNNPSLIYAESQYGGLNVGTTGVDPLDRINWNTPFVFNPQNTNSLYLGTDKIYKTTDNGTFWNPISTDLTNGSGTASYPIVYGTVTTIAVAPSDSNVIYAGTDDGNVWVTFNEGANWSFISGGLPYRWVTRIAVDQLNPMTAYVTLSGYRYHDNFSHVYKTTSAGNSWIDIGANLPDVPVNDIIYDSTLLKLYIATDIGVFYSDADTMDWQMLGDSMPLVPVLDLRLHEGTRTLLAATYGRSMFKYDLTYLISGTQENLVTSTATIKSAFPNPFSSQLHFEVYAGSEEMTKIELIDLNGRTITLIFEGKLSKGRHALNLFNAGNRLNLNEGIYFISLQTARSRMAEKVVFRK